MRRRQIAWVVIVVIPIVVMERNVQVQWRGSGITETHPTISEHPHLLLGEQSLFAKAAAVRRLGS
jgi:hypothetical protein